MSKAANTFHYKNVGGNLRPIIPVELQKKNSTVKLEVLIDSGADRCIIWGEIAEALGIDVKAGKEHKFGGIGSTRAQIGYEHKVGITVGQETINATVIFSYDIAQGLAIVGQEGFFDHFVIKFDYKKRSIVLRRN